MRAAPSHGLRMTPRLCARRGAARLRQVREVVPDVATAIARLEGFKFVGLQEEWATSVCLFHAMHGGECFGVEVADTHVGNYSGLEATAGSVQSGVTLIDQYDSELYNMVVQRFRADVLAYNVTHESCQRICPALAEHFTSHGTN